MEIDARVEAWASLQLLPGVSPRILAGLLKALGGPEEVRSASRANLAKLVPTELASVIESGPDPALLERTLSWIAEPGHALISWDDADYPRALLTISDPPPAFYYRGRRQLPSPEPSVERPLPRRSGRRGNARQRLADYRAICRRAGSRGIRHSGFDSFPLLQRQPSSDQRRCQAG